MVRAKTLIAAYMAVAVTTAHAKPPVLTEADYGARPVFTDGVVIAEREVRSRLVDPDSAKFRWPYDFGKASLKGVFTRRYTGFWICGRVNARNHMGGYSGESWASIMLHEGKALFVEIGDNEEFDTVKMECEAGISNGRFAPAPAPALNSEVK